MLTCPSERDPTRIYADTTIALRYFGAYIIFVAFLFGSAFAQNYATLIVTRFVCQILFLPLRVDPDHKADFE